MKATPQLAAALNRLTAIERDNSFDPLVIGSQPTPDQRRAIEACGVTPHIYLFGGNGSGKSITGSKNLALFTKRAHPTWQYPALWKTETLKILVVGRTAAAVEEELWDQKLKHYWVPSDYTAIRVANQLHKVRLNTNGQKATILFMSHHSPSTAWEKVQSFHFHYVWLDELPNDIRVLEELHRRVQSKGGIFFCTATPKLKNDKIRKLIDTPSTVHTKIQLDTRKNPIFTTNPDKLNQLLESVKTYSADYKNMILNGDWYAGENSVYHFVHSRDIRSLPVDYSPTWRHVAAFDPAVSGLGGLTIWAETPIGVWLCVKAIYIEGAAPSVLVANVEQHLVGLNIVRRVADPNATWFIEEAKKQGFVYRGIYNKKERKHELIKNLQQRLTDEKIKIADTNCAALIEEFAICQWHETEDRIVGASKYHLLDSAQYAIDLLPAGITTAEIKSNDPDRAYQSWLRAENKKRLAKQQILLRRGVLSRWKSRRQSWRRSA